MIEIISKIIIIILLLNSFKYRNINIVNLEIPKLLVEEYKNIFYLINMRKSLDIFRKKTKIENILILIAIFPFLKSELTITKKSSIYGLCKKIFSIKNGIKIKLNKSKKNELAGKLREILYYNWEMMPNKNITNYIRHILFHFYPEECINIYEYSLNYNIKHFINNNKEKISYELISDLMSKIRKYIILKVILELLPKLNV